MTGIKNSINDYFDSVTYGALAAVLPATFIIVSTFCIMVIAGDPPGKIKIVESMIVPKTFKGVFLSSLLGIIICFWDIVKFQLRQYSIFNYRKSLLNALMIFIHCFYSVIIFLFVELSKFGNIPVGKN